MQDRVNRAFGGRFPQRGSSIWATGLTAREQDAVVTQAAQHLLARAKHPEATKDKVNRALDLEIGVLDDTPIWQANKTSGSLLTEDTSLDLALAASSQAQLEKMQLGLAQHPAQPEEEAVIGGARVIDALAVGDQSSAQCCKVEERVPIGVVSRQAAGFVGQDNPDMAE
jgi:hypothetical protein